MATFQITTPEGTFKVTAPSEDEALAALNVDTESEASRNLRAELSARTLNPAAAQYEDLPGWQKPFVAANDILNMTVNGITYGFGDKAAAGVRSRFTGKSYEDELKEQRRKTQGSRSRSGWAGTAAEVAGAVAPAARLAGAGGTFTRFAPLAPPGLPRLAAVSAGAAADGAALGTISALGNDMDVATSAAVGAAIGGLTPGALALIKNTFAPLWSRLAPQRAANAAITNMVERTGRPAQQIVDDLNRAAQEGQGGAFMAADAMGNPGQRMLSTIARTPGDARGRVVEALEARQAGQGNRVASFLTDAFGAPQTAAQTEAARIASRRAGGSANYGAARAAAGAVDVSAARQMLDDIVSPGVSRIIGTGAKDNGVYATLRRMRDLLGRNNARVTDFERAHMAKIEMDAIIEQGGPAAGLLRPARNALDDALSTASQPYAGARDAYRQASQNIEAVDIGRAAATRGRFEDTIPQFQRMSAGEQSGFRAGYVDPLIERAQRAATGVNKARPLISDKTAREFPAFAVPGQGPQFGRQLGREQRMFETRNQALGGSRTADNLADQAEMALIDPTILGNIISGNWGSALASMGRGTIANFQGLSPSVRSRIADVLLERNPTALGRRLADAIREGRRLSQREIANVRFLMVVGTSAANQRKRNRQR